MGPAAIALLAVSVVMGAMAANEQNKALAAQTKAAGEQADLDIKELDRQRDFVNAEAAATKSERASEADKATARVLVAMADMGGAGTANETRITQEVDYYEAIDLARLEGNRSRENESKRAQQVVAKNRALNIGIQNKYAAKANTFKFISSSASMAASAFGGAPGTTPNGTAGSYGSGTRMSGMTPSGNMIFSNSTGRLGGGV